MDNKVKSSYRYLLSKKYGSFKKRIDFIKKYYTPGKTMLLPAVFIGKFIRKE